MHHRLDYIYNCSCNTCKAKNEALNLSSKKPFKKLLKSVEKAFKKLHKNRKYTPEDLVKVPEFKQVVDDTSEILNNSLNDNDLSEELVEQFKNDVYIFSGLKTHAQLLEASKLLFTKDNKIKSFDLFSNDVSKIKKDYNETYLEAEQDYVVGTIQQVERWESFSDSKRYYLQYRTASDEKVRDTHAALHNITLPKKDTFWFYYTPKNGWRCRCSLVQVLASLNEVSDSIKAIEKGEKATTQIGKNGKNKLEIFRYNPAMQKVIFPPKHPYHKVLGAKKVKRLL